MTTALTDLQLSLPIVAATGEAPRAQIATRLSANRQKGLDLPREESVSVLAG
jgi:hypothetical protein